MCRIDMSTSFRETDAPDRIDMTSPSIRSYDPFSPWVVIEPSVNDDSEIETVALALMSIDPPQHVARGWPQQLLLSYA